MPIDPVYLEEKDIKRDLESLPRGTPKPTLEEVAFMKKVEKSIIEGENDVAVRYKRDKKIGETDLKKILSFVGPQKGLVFYPTFIPPYTGLGYEVAHVITDKPGGDNVKATVLMTFPERSLPQGYNFNKLSKTFMSKANMVLMEAAGMELPNMDGNYDY